MNADQRGAIARNYDTSLDRFRVRERIDIQQWAQVAEMRRTTLNRYRAGESEPNVRQFARLLRAASRILGRAVFASELYDFGENEPVAPQPPRRTYNASSRSRKAFNSRLDRLLRKFGLTPTALARDAGVSTHGLLKIRADKDTPMISTIRQLVQAFRRLGCNVRAPDIIDLGEVPVNSR